MYDCKTQKEAEEFLRKTQKTRDRDHVTARQYTWLNGASTWGKGGTAAESGENERTVQTFRRSDEAKTSKTTSGAVTVVGKEESQRQTRRKLRVVQSSVGEGRIL